jgi:hypothetical protein
MNKNGRRTAYLVERLKVERDSVPAGQDSTELAEALDGTVHEGELFQTFWADLIHGEDGRDPREVATTRLLLGGAVSANWDTYTLDPQPANPGRYAEQRGSRHQESLGELEEGRQDPARELGPPTP